MKTLQEQIADLIAKDELQKMVEQALPGITMYSTTRDGFKSMIWPAVPVNFEKAKKIFAAFPPTEKSTEIGRSRDSFYKVLESPYRVDIKNPAKYDNATLGVAYVSGDYDIHMKFPIELFTDFVTAGYRGVTSSEHHYFTGHSLDEMCNIRLREYSFKAKQEHFYGGDKTLLNVETIAEIIKRINQ